MSITTFLAIVIAVALGVAFAPYVRPLLRFLLALACLLVAFGGALLAVALLVIAFVWRDAVSGFGYWYYAAVGVPAAMSLAAFKAKEWYSHRCPVCKERLFVGEADPLDYYLAGRGGWGGVPLAVRLGSWRKVWRRQWYHQTCCGVDVDAVNRDGHWYIFGSALREPEAPATAEQWKELLDAATGHTHDGRPICQRCGEPIPEGKEILLTDEEKNALVQGRGVKSLPGAFRHMYGECAKPS